jgi:pimeloyl-ACP methyl ester carboxylesterase
MNEFNYYLIPGMGANHRIYEKFKLENGRVHYLDWVDHRKSATLKDLAVIMAERINTSNNIIIGSSMGGMMAVELSHIVKPVSTILISAPTKKGQFPAVLKLIEKLKIHRLTSVNTIPKLYKLANTFMDFKNEDQKEMFFEMLNGLPPEFIHFSVRAVLEWENQIGPSGKHIQIIGSEDRLFNPKKMYRPIVLQGGGHFSAFDRGEQISEIINEYIRKEFIEKRNE